LNRGLVLLGLIASVSAYSCQPLYNYAPTPQYSNTSGSYYTGIYYDPIGNNAYTINSYSWPSWASNLNGIWCAGCVYLTPGVTYNTTGGNINTYGQPISASTWTTVNGASTCSLVGGGACYTVPNNQQALFCATAGTSCQLFYSFNTVPNSYSPAATSGRLLLTSWSSYLTASNNQIFCSDAPSLTTYGLASVVTIIMALFVM